jgi:hypothetical protein
LSERVFNGTFEYLAEQQLARYRFVLLVLREVLTMSKS